MPLMWHGNSKRSLEILDPKYSICPNMRKRPHSSPNGVQPYPAGDRGSYWRGPRKQRWRPGQTQTAPGPVSAQFVCGTPSLRSPFRHSLKHRRRSNNIKLKPRRHTRLFKCMSLYNRSRRYKSSRPQALMGTPLYSTQLRVFGSECASMGILRSGVMDPTGSVYFISVPGITSARSPPTAMVQLEAGGQR